MNVTYFFRKPSPHFHSIEELFFNIQKHLPSDFKYKNYFAKHESKGFFKRLFISLFAINHQNQINHITGDIHFITSFLNKQKTILTIHDTDSILRGNVIKRNILKFFWFTIPTKRAKYITVVSEFTKKQLLEKLNIKPEKIIVIPNCISPNLEYIPKSFNSKKPVLLHIGTHKNLERTIEAIQNIDCTFIVLGKFYPGQEDLLKKAKISYENYVNLTYDEVIKLYQKTDILLFASTYEGFGVPIIEANATGACVITSNLSPMKEVAGNSAVLINPYNTSEITEAVEKIIKSEVFRNKLINLGLENAKKYSATEIAQKYANLYKKMNSFTR